MADLFAEALMLVIKTVMVSVLLFGLGAVPDVAGL